MGMQTGYWRRVGRLRAGLLGAAGLLLVSGVSVLAAPATSGAAGAARSRPAAAAPAKKVVHRCFGVLPGRPAGPSSGGGYSTQSAVTRRQIQYPEGCLGHDEPDLAPVTSAANTAQNVTWTVVLPLDGTGAGSRRVMDLGPTFWFGATLQDSNSLFGQAFDELQFYPDSTLAAPYCGTDGSYFIDLTPNKYTMCSPVWAVDTKTFSEHAVFNGLVTRSGSTSPLVLNGGDTVTVHLFAGAQTGNPLNIVVADITTGKQSTPLVVSSVADGPLTPVTGSNVTSNFLQWGLIDQAPMSMSWEIGHPNIYDYPLAPECLPGMFNCYSYNVTKGWQHITPLEVKKVQFANGVQPTSWAVVDGQGGIALDSTWCGTYNAAGSNGSCTFPWYSYNSTAGAIEFGGSYAGVTNTYNTAHQYPQSRSCAGPEGSNSTYCATSLTPKPAIP